LFETQLSEKSFKLSARLEVDYINERFKLDLPENEQYETIGGLIVHETENIPDVMEEVIIDRYSFKILEKSNNKIDLVELTILDED
jgi:CBS domain containing-hemolysin-like protein